MTNFKLREEMVNHFWRRMNTLVSETTNENNSLRITSIENEEDLFSELFEIRNSLLTLCTILNESLASYKYSKLLVLEVAIPKKDTVEQMDDFLLTILHAFRSIEETFIFAKMVKEVEKCQ
jgi:hypothetical protein